MDRPPARDPAPLLRALLLLFALATPVLAGCLGGLAGPTEPVPTWQVGASWSYAVRDGAGDLVEHRTYTVEAVETVPDVTDRAYRVDLARTEVDDRDHSGKANETSHRTEHFDAATLNDVWNVCDQNRFMHGPCKGRTPHLDFPMRDGWAWTYPCCGDVITMRRRVPTHLGERQVDGRNYSHLWRIEEHHKLDRGWEGPFEVDLYDPSVGFLVHRARYGWTDEPEPEDRELVPWEVWTLTGYRRPDG